MISWFQAFAFKFNLYRYTSDVARLSGLKTLIISNNALTSLPAAIGQLSQLKVLEAEHNQIAELPAELANCKALENLRWGCVTS
jgi:Leucine-rich repeat (LRR) protein